jgi:hypothetical protein
METYDVINANPQLAETLTGLGDEAIGILGATAPLGQFDQGVYQYWNAADMPGKPGQKYKTHLSATEMQTKIELSGAWREYSNAKADRDAVLKQRGGLSMDAAINADVKAQWTDFTDNWMRNKYGPDWTVAFSDYQAKQGQYLEGVVAVLNDSKFSSSTDGQSPLWSNVRQYMDIRQQAVDAVRKGADPQEVNKQFEEWSNQFRFTSLQFSDFWDNYLANDKLSIGVGSIV